MSNKINVCFATANDYQYVVIAIVSLLENTQINSTVFFHFLVSDDFDDEAETNLRNLCVKYNSNCCFYNVGKQFCDAKTHIPWIATPTYYRLAIPELLADEDKCLYLDADVIVLQDIKEIYNIDISRYMVGGVYAIAYHKYQDEKPYCTQAELPSLNQYINAGVLLMNLEQMRAHNFTEIAMGLISRNYPSQDQDIVNKLCYDHIKILPFKYNCMTKYYNWNDYDYEPLYRKEDIAIAWNDPVVIHYADKNKPWRNFATPMAEYWWYYCRKSDVWKWWMDKAADEFIYRSFYDRNPVDKEIERKAIIQLRNRDGCLVYGAGKIAKKIIWRLTEMDVIVRSILVTSIMDNPIEIDDIPVIQVDNVNAKYYPLPVVVAVMDSYCSDVISTLWSKGFSKLIMLKNEDLM